MRVWLKAAPCLARASTFGLGLSSSVVFSCSGEVLADFFLLFFHNKWVTKAKYDIRISGIAPDCLLDSKGVSAVVVLTKALIWEIRR